MHKLKVLVVDDYDLNRDICREILSGEYYVETVDSGEHALEMVVDYKPNVVLLDIMMPGIDGYETCRKLRSIPELQDIKIVMLSAKAMSDEKEQGINAGADQYITKPFRPKELLECMQRISEEVALFV